MIVCGRKPDTVGAVAAQLGPGHLGIDCDVSSYQSIVQMARRVAEATDGIDVVLASAGIAIYKSLADWTEEDFDTLFAVNTKGQFFTVQKLAPLMHPGGAMILVGSVAARLGQPDMAVYGASKASAPALARMLSADMLSRQVRVFCLTPGPVDTPIFENGGLSAEQARAKLEEVGARIPLRRTGRAEELAAAALFLASDESSYMLGSEIVVDGGKSQL